MNTLEHCGSDHRVILVPHLIEKFSVSLCKSPASAEGVLFIQVCFKAFVKEVFCEFPAVAETLQAAIHVAGVAEVAEADLSISGGGAPLEGGNTFLEFSVCLGAASGDVPSLVFFLATVTAISHSLASAFNFQDLFLSAKFALANENSLILHKSERKPLR